MSAELQENCALIVFEVSEYGGFCWFIIKSALSNIYNCDFSHAWKSLQCVKGLGPLMEF
jgi:hypothetical protein